MKICIVGHGPSLKGTKKGSEIDSFDKVIRMKHGLLNDEDYGSKTDLLVASTEVPGCFKKGIACIAYPKNGWFDERPFEMLGFPVTIPLNFFNRWNAAFRQLGAKHPNVSTGMAAILVSIEMYRPEEAVLAGFDTLLNPEIPFGRNDAIPRTGVGDFPNHDWEKEKELLDVVSKAYSVSIRALINYGI